MKKAVLISMVLLFLMAGDLFASVLTIPDYFKAQANSLFPITAAAMINPPAPQAGGVFDKNNTLQDYTHTIQGVTLPSVALNATPSVLENVAMDQPKTAPVPEPGTLFLLGAGAIAIGMITKNRKQYKEL